MQGYATNYNAYRQILPVEKRICHVDPAFGKGSTNENGDIQAADCRVDRLFGNHHGDEGHGLAVAVSAGHGPPILNWEPLGAQTRRPIGWHNLCLVQAGECQAAGQRPVNVELTPEARRLLTTVTVLANRVILAETDDEHYHIDRKRR